MPATQDNSPAGPGPVRNSRKDLRAVLQFIDHHLSSDLSVRTMADFMGMPVLQFARQFRETTGQTLWEYVRHRQAATTRRTAAP
jgi:AraC-like DNA-binding protein